MSKNRYFDRESSSNRRLNRLNNISNIKNMFKKSSSGDLTTQNVGIRSVKLVSDILDKFNLPSSIRLSYSGIKNGKTASNCSRLNDGVITVYASAKTGSNIGFGFDIPVMINNGNLLDPSIIIYNGAVRVLAQSTFDDIVNNNTFKEVQPVRGMYSAPFDDKTAKNLYSNRNVTQRVNRGMFSLSGAREAIRKAISLGKDIDVKINKEAGTLTREEIQYIESLDATPEEKVRLIRDMIELDDQKNVNTKEYDLSQQIYLPDDYNRKDYDDSSPSYDTVNIRNPHESPTQQDESFLETDKVEMPTDKVEMPTEVSKRESATTINMPKELQYPRTPPKPGIAKMPRPKQQNTLKQPKTPKAPKPKTPKAPGLKAKPQQGRLCSKCNHAPCTCPGKKKSSIYRDIK